MEDAVTLRSADVDVIYRQAIKDQERKADSDNLNSHLHDDLYPDAPVKDAYMNFEGFQDAVVMLSAKYRPNDPLDDAVRQTLKDTVYIHAGMKHEDEEEAEEWDNEMLVLFQKAQTCQLNTSHNMRTPRDFVSSLGVQPRPESGRPKSL